MAFCTAISEFDRLLLVSHRWKVSFVGNRAICFQDAATGCIYDYVNVTGNVVGNVETSRNYVPQMPCNAPRHGAQCTVCTTLAHYKIPAYLA
jgi:hypothetical protein